jgi:hypothetical protein
LWREQLLTVPDIVERINYRAHQMRAMRLRRSVGIKKIVVSHVAQKLYAWDVTISDNKGEFETIKLEGQFPLTRLYGNVYNAQFEVPRGGAVELIVHWMGGHVMLACPGRPWKVHCQIGKDSK